MFLGAKIRIVVARIRVVPHRWIGSRLAMDDLETEEQLFLFPIRFPNLFSV